MFFEDHLPRAPRDGLTPFQLALATMVGIAAISVVVASLRLTDASVQRGLDEREAPERFLAQELSVLRLTAMTSASVVPGRLYLGIEECFRARAPVPFAASAAAGVLATCEELEIGRLQAQGGTRMADEGRRVLRETVSAGAMR